jgi:hypothetical protein
MGLPSLAAIKNAYNELPAVVRDVVEHTSDLSTIDSTLVDKYYNDPNVGKDSFEAIGVSARIQYYPGVRIEFYPGALAARHGACCG